MKRDDLHFTFKTVDGYSKPFVAVISEREAGKSTAAWCDKAWKAYKNGKSTIVIRRLINDITDVYINDIGEVINKFAIKPIKLIFKKGSIKDGVVDVYTSDEPDRLFFRVIALSNPMSRIKSLIVRNLKYIIFDEFICNTKLGEKYLNNEAFKFKELFNTFQRENPDLTCYFLGNPYSVYTPYFEWWGVDYAKLKPGAIVKGDVWVIQCYQILPELKELILKRNPLYKFDDAYKNYAFGGIAINDANLRIRSKQPESYYLSSVFHIDNDLIGVYRSNSEHAWEEGNVFWVGKVRLEDLSANRYIQCFDLNDLDDRHIMYTKDLTIKYQTLKLCIGTRYVEYQDIGVAYKMYAVYQKL